MVRPLTVLAAMVLISGAVWAQELVKISMDDIAGLTPRIEIDDGTKIEGRASARITVGWSTTVCLGEVAALDAENAKLVVTARVKSDLDGKAFLEMWIHLDGNRYFSKGIHDAVEGKSDWRTIHAPFLLQAGQRPDRVTLNLAIEGKGTVWIDDVVLSQLPLTSP